MKKVLEAIVQRELGTGVPAAGSTERAAAGHAGVLVALLAVLGLVLASCTPGLSGSTPAGPRDTRLNTTSRDQGGTRGPVLAPSPSATPDRPGRGPIPDRDKTGQGSRAPRVVTATNSVATFLSFGWTRYDSINQVFDLVFAPDGTLWAATGGGLVHWEPDSGTYTRHDLSPGRIALAPNGTLWLVIDGELWHFDGTTARFVMAPGALYGPIRSLVVQPDGTLWVATGRDVRRFDGSDWRDYPSVAGASMLALGPSGEVWAATHEGIGRHQPEDDTWVFYTEENGLPGRNTHVISVDPEGQVWAYWPGEGIYAMKGSPDDPAWARLEDPCRTRLSDLAFAADGTAWASSAGSGHYPGACVAYFDGEDWVETTQGQGLSATAALALGPSGQVAASTSQGLAIYDGDAWRLLRDGPTTASVTVAAVTPDGDAWLGFGDNSVSTPGGGLSRFDGQTWEYHLDGAEVTALAVAPDSALWAGAGCTVRRFDGTAWQTLVHCEEELPPGNILDIAFTPDGTAWVANGFSLASYDGSTWTVLDKLANSIVAAPEGVPRMEGLWVSGWEGTPDSMYVARLDGSSWEQYTVCLLYTSDAADDL